MWQIFLNYKFEKTSNYLPCFGYSQLSVSLDVEKQLLALKNLPATTCFFPIQGLYSGQLHTQLLERSDFRERNPSYCIELSLSIDSLRRATSRRRRSKLYPKTKDGISFSTDKSELTNFFVDNYESTMSRLEASSRFKFSSSTLRYLCSLENVFLVGVKKEERIEMVLLHGVTNGHVEYVFSSSTEAGKIFSTFALWKSVEFFKAKNFETFHLGGGIISGDGLEDFKRQFGGRKFFNGGIRVLIDDETYERQLQKTTPAQVDFFPPYLAARVLGSAK